MSSLLSLLASTVASGTTMVPVEVPPDARTILQRERERWSMEHARRRWARYDAEASTTERAGPPAEERQRALREGRLAGV